MNKSARTLRLSASAVALTALALIATSGHAAVVTQNVVPTIVSNGNFETSPTTSGDYCYVVSGPRLCSSLLSGWTSAGGVVAIGTGSGAWGTPGAMNGASNLGNFVLGLQGSGSSIAQSLDLGAGLYTLSWVDAGRSGYAAQDYQVLWGSTVLGSFHTEGGQAWSSHTLTFAATGLGTLSFGSLGTSAVDRTSLLDNVVVTAATSAVPEPATLPVVATALAGLALLRRRARG